MSKFILQIPLTSTPNKATGKAVRMGNLKFLFLFNEQGRTSWNKDLRIEFKMGDSFTFWFLSGQENEIDMSIVQSNINLTINQGNNELSKSKWKHVTFWMKILRGTIWKITQNNLFLSGHASESSVGNETADSEEKVEAGE